MCARDARDATTRRGRARGLERAPRAARAAGCVNVVRLVRVGERVGERGAGARSRTSARCARGDAAVSRASGKSVARASRKSVAEVSSDADVSEKTVKRSTSTMVTSVVEEEEDGLEHVYEKARWLDARAEPDRRRWRSGGIGRFTNCRILKILRARRRTWRGNRSRTSSIEG